MKAKMMAVRLLFAALFAALIVMNRLTAWLALYALSLLIPHASNWLHSGRTPDLLGSAHPNIAPYDSFRTRDGAVFLGILNDVQFTRFSTAIERPDLPSDPRFASNAARLQHRDALRVEIEAAFAGRSKAELCQALMSKGIPAGPVNTVPEALEHPHAVHRGMRVERDGYRGLGLPIRLHGTPGQPGATPPLFDEHADIREDLQTR